MNKEFSSRCDRTSDLPRLGDVNCMAFSKLVVFSLPDGNCHMVIKNRYNSNF